MLSSGCLEGSSKSQSFTGLLTSNFSQADKLVSNLSQVFELLTLTELEFIGVFIAKISQAGLFKSTEIGGGGDKFGILILGKSQLTFEPV